MRAPGLRGRHRNMLTPPGVQACIDVANATKKAEATTKRQLDGEKKKDKANKSKVAQLEDRCSTLEETLDTLEMIMKQLFEGVFIHRYR